MMSFPADEPRPLRILLAEDDEANPALRLGAAMGGTSPLRDKLYLVDHGTPVVGFGDWAEQLIAESTGKQGVGLVPVVVDDGAVVKLRDEGKSLLPIGMVEVLGEFHRGDVIAVRNLRGEDIARGLANYASSEARLLVRRPSAETVTPTRSRSRPNRQVPWGSTSRAKGARPAWS